MSYTKSTDFAAKDALLSGNPAKLIKGTELDAEFEAIQAADALNVKTDGQLPATAVTTQQSGSSTTRTLQAVLYESVSVKDFGAVGDGSTDDTTAIQSAITAVLSSSGGCLFFPEGTYKITSALTIPQVVGTRIYGDSTYGSIIKQFSANKEIFKFTTCTSHQFEIDHLTLTYNSAQNNSQTSAIAIHFVGTTGSSAEGFFNFNLHHLWITNAFRAIGAAQTGGDTGGLAVWGMSLDRLVTSNCSGASIYINPSPSIGIPQTSITNILINYAATAEQAVILGSCQEVFGNNWSLSGGTLTDTNQFLVYFSTCTSVNLSNIHLEDTAVSSTDLTRAFLNFSNCSGTVHGIVGSFAMANAAQCSIVNSNSGSTMNIESVRTGCTTTGSGQVIAIFVGTFGRLFDYAWTSTGSAGSVSTLYATATAVDAWDATNAFYATGTANLGVAFGGGATGITYGARQCRWTRVGNLVYLRFRILLSSKGSDTGNATITGLPFNVNANADSTITPLNVSNATVLNMGFFPNASAKTATLYYGQVGGAYTNVTDANFTNTSDIGGHLFYEADWT